MDVNKINLEITLVSIGGNPEINNGNIRIHWSSDIGFGICDIYVKKDGTLEADTETMGKEFLKKLLALLSEKIKIK